MGSSTLAERLRDGDQAAFAELYVAYADRIFGLCFTILRDRDEAGDATHDTFVTAVQRIHQLRDPERLRSWMFAIARHVCFRKLAERRRAAPADLDVDVLVLEPDPGAGLAADESAALVWAAAEGLNERDRTVIDLNTRGGLEGADLADALGVQHANPYSLLHRAKDQLERAVAVLVVARAGRHDCGALADLLGNWDGHLTPLLRKRIGRHLDSCSACQQTRSRILPATALATAPVLAPGRADAWVPTAMPSDLLEIAARRPRSDERWQRDGFPPPIDASARRRRRLFALVAAGALGLLVAALLFTATSADPPPATVVAQPSRPESEAEAAPAKAPTTTTTRATAPTTAPATVVAGSPPLAPVPSGAPVAVPSTVIGTALTPLAAPPAAQSSGSARTRTTPPTQAPTRAPGKAPGKPPAPPPLVTTTTHAPPTSTTIPET